MCFDYLKTTKNWANHSIAIGKPIDDEDLVSYILNGLNPSYNFFVISYSIATLDKTPSFADLQEELLSHEMLLHKQQSGATDTSPFALHMQKGKQISQHFNKKMRGPQFNRFSPKPGPPRGNPSGFAPQHSMMPPNGSLFSSANCVPC